MTRATEQRLEAWMREVTDLLCYQPEVPMAHKTALVEAMQNFGRQIEHEDKLRQKTGPIPLPVEPKEGGV